ncbi:nuclear pore complex protein Nup160-like [Styela clava]
MDIKDPALFLQEIPIHSKFSQRPAQEISVPEGEGPVDASENVTFPESGGGVTLQLQDSTRVICWRTQKNSLEIFEYSLDVDLFSSHFIISFEGTKIIPGVDVSLFKNRLYITCCTLHAVHRMSIDTLSTGRSGPKSGVSYPSLLSNLATFNFENEFENFYFGEKIQGLVTEWSVRTMLPDKGDPYTAVALKTNQGNMALVNMTSRSPPTIANIYQASRMSRIWSGINPWGEAAGTETISDIAILVIENHPYVVAACKDRKLRLWSFETHDMLVNYDLSAHFQDDGDKSKAVDLKVRVVNEVGMISLYICMSDQAGFLQFQVKMDSSTGTLETNFLSVVFASLSPQGLPHRHLVDYFLTETNKIFTLWRDTEEVDSISVCAADVGVWHEVASHPSPVLEIPLLPYQDVGEAYMDYIFSSGKFSPVALTRTLSIHQRSNVSNMAYLQPQELKERVAAHIQNAIQEIIPDEEMDEDALQVSVWNSFYQDLIQYQQVVSRSLGLIINHGSSQSLVSVIKKGYLMILAPVSPLEAVCRGSDPDIFRTFLQPDDCTDANLNDLAQLLESLGKLHSYLGAELVESIQQSLCLAGNSPPDVIEDMMPDIQGAVRESSGNDTWDNLIIKINDVSSAVKMLTLCLSPSEFAFDFDMPDLQSWPAGSLGVEFISRCIMRHVENRFQLSILLYVLSSLLETLQRQDGHIQQEGDTQLGFRIVSFVQAYQAMFWLSTVQTQNISQATLESTMQTLSVHDSTLSIDREAKSTLAQGHQTVLEFFISSDGGKLLQAYLQNQQGQGIHILHSGLVTNFVNFVVYLMWPLGPTLTLLDFLLSHGHYTVLQRYIQRELGDWCNWSTKSQRYMLAHCHLHNGNFDKAVQSFIMASSGISNEDYLANKLLKEDEENFHPAAQEIIYYTKVLPIFERLDLPEQVITLAEHAIQVAKSQEHDPNVSILWSSIFRQSNLLQRHCNALKAIVLNPDPDHRKDCLRTLAVSLCEHKKYKTLVEFQYGELEGDLVSILEHRARGTDLATSPHNYYDLLYAFHIERKNFRKASSAMYEQGYRISCEFAPSTSEEIIACLQKQIDCYVACINCLHLTAVDNRWILHPIGNHMKAASQKPEGYRSPKRQNDGEVAEQQKRKVIIHEIPDIQKEVLLVEMKLKLQEVSKDSMQTAMSPLVSESEISGLLCHSGLYDDAIKVCNKFNLSLATVFSSLASKCVYLSYADDRAMAEGWEWLQENETVKVHCRGGKSSTAKWTAADAAYRLLQVYLERHGNAEGRGTQYFYAVAKSLLGLSAKLPAWFVNTYKGRNSPELLRLLVCFDRLEEAVSLAIELITMAKIQVGTDFDETSYLRRGTWVPYTIIEQLLSVLEELRVQPEFDELFHHLNETLDEYLHVAETTSDDMVQASLQRAEIAMQS